MEREKRVLSRPSDKYKPLVDRLTGWDNDNSDRFIIANYDKENTGDYCNNKGDSDNNGFDNDGLSIDIDGCDSGGDGGDSCGDDGGDCGD